MTHYNLIVLVANLFVAMLCGAIALLLASQLQRDSKARIFLIFATLECLSATSFTVARVLGVLEDDMLRLFFHVCAVIWSAFPSLLFSIACEFFDLWTPLKRRVAQLFLVLPALMAFGIVVSTMFRDLRIGEAGSFAYSPALATILIVAVGELLVFYALILVLRNALTVKAQGQRWLILGVVIALTTALLLPSQVLFRTFGAIGTSVSVLMMTASILRYRLFDPLTQLNVQLQEALTKNVQLLDQVQSADKAKTRFMSYLSHELRNPLANILNSVQFMDTPGFFDEPLPIEYRQIKDDIQGQTQHMLALINDLLDLGSIEAGELKLTKSTIDAVKILNEVQSSARVNLQPDVALVTTYPSRIQNVYADSLRLRQILANIVGNAAKFTEHGTITLSAGVDNDKVRFAIADTGLGMTDEVLSRLFQPYTQDLRKSGDPRKGTGLGLSITKQLVELHQGTIEVNSAVDKGTTVTFTIPLAATDLSHTG